MHGSLFLKKKMGRPNFQYIGERFQSLCELADSYGIRLTLENVHWCQYHEVGYAREMCIRDRACIGHAAVFGKPVLSIALLFVEDKRSVDGRRIVLAGCAAARLGLK